MKCAKSIESTECQNWVPKRKIVNSDLVYSPAQVTEHRQVELRDQDVPEKTKLEFKKLKADYPEVFSAEQSGYWSYPIGLQCMSTLGTHPPSVKKLYTLPLKTLQLGTA